MNFYPDEEPEPISNSAEFTEYDNSVPQIGNACNIVVWQGCNDSDCEIFLYDGVKTVNISNDPYHDDEDPRINNSGRVVWVKNYASSNGGLLVQDINYWMKGREIMLYRHCGETVANISNRNGDDVDPQINDFGEVVWSGQIAQSNWEIFKAIPGMELGIICTSLCPPVLGPAPGGNYPIVILEEAPKEEAMENETSETSVSIVKKTSVFPRRSNATSLSLR